MSGINFNITDELASIKSFNMLEVNKLEDLPPEVGGIRDFGLNQGLDIKANIFDSFVWRWPDESFIFIWTKYANQATIFYTGADTFIQCAGQCGTVIFRNTNIFGLNPAVTAKAFDLTASLNVGPASFGINDTAFTGFPGGARLKNYPNGIIRGMVWFNNQFTSTISEGVSLENCGVYELGGMLMIGIGNTNQSLLSIMGPATAQGRMHDIDWNVPGNQSGIYLGSNITTLAAMGTFAVSQPGTGTFFKTQQSGAFQDIADGSTSGSVSSVTARATIFGNFAVFNATTTPLEGDIINHTTFSEAAYNGKFKAHRVDPGVSYQIALFPFQQPVLEVPAASSSGNWDREYTVINSSDTSELRIGFGVELFNSSVSFYDGFHTVLELIDNVSFSIQADFQGVTSVTGDYTVKSLDETNIQVDVDRAGRQKSSKSIALGAVNSHVGTTGTLDGSYVAMNVAGFLDNIVLERFTLSNSVIGEFTYTGQNPFQGFITGALAATKSGSARNYRFAMSFNGGIPLFNAIAGGIILTVESGTNGRARFNHALTTPPIGSIVNISNFAVNLNYNGRFLVVFSNPTQFECKNVLFGTDEASTGNFSVPQANYIPMEVKTAKVVVPLIFMAQLETGDTISIMVAGDGTPDFLTVTDLGYGVF